MPEKQKCFISYSREDEAVLGELVESLQALQWLKDHIWFDKKGIEPSDQIDPLIQQALKDTKVGILLISNKFFLSDYIEHKELPHLLAGQAKQSGIKLACLYLTSIAEEAFVREVVIDGQQHSINLRDFLGLNDPNQPLDSLKTSGEKNKAYKKVADWVAKQFPLAERQRRRDGSKRPKLAIAIHKQRDHWRHSYSLPNAPNFSTSSLDYLAIDSLKPEYIQGETLFRLLFPDNMEQNQKLLGTAFDLNTPAEPSLYPLRIELMTDDEQLLRLPWSNIAYNSGLLRSDGWTVEFHGEISHGYPENPSHTCYLPGKVILASPPDYQQSGHIADLQTFFQHNWRDMTPPTVVADTEKLSDELNRGSTRLLYYFGQASSEGLLSGTADTILPWQAVIESLRQSQSVSLVFLNLIGETSEAVFTVAGALAATCKALLIQVSGRRELQDAAASGYACLKAILSGEQLDPVVAMHRHGRGYTAAWTTYSSWRTIAQDKPQYPDLLELLLDRRAQRAELLQAKEDFLKPFPARRIYHSVAVGSAGNRTVVFPKMVSQHLKITGRRDNEVILYKEIALDAWAESADAVDDAARRALSIEWRQSIIEALLRTEQAGGNDLWFVVLGWVLPEPVDDQTQAETLIRIVSDWCHDRLVSAIADYEQAGQRSRLRIISVQAIEVPTKNDAEALVKLVRKVGRSYDNQDMFYVGRLGPLAGVEFEDLQHYFQDRYICSCDDRYRKDFPDLLLGKNRDQMPFDQAVTAIERGPKEGWGNLYDELTERTANGSWPPAE
ncbi:MAG: toll/interleukin-1 receptor domain-containing protein [Candidatus Competibacteraceae bacterium]|nr:toll/interleukin-1 receptor domain-containing protein [Candidatus Competibacteraceae bacterium]